MKHHQIQAWAAQTGQTSAIYKLTALSRLAQHILHVTRDLRMSHHKTNLLLIITWSPIFDRQYLHYNAAEPEQLLHNQNVTCFIFL